MYIPDPANPTTTLRPGDIEAIAEATAARLSEIVGSGAMTFGLVVAGQMLVSLAFDHFGLLGVEEKPVNIPRILGALLVAAGVVLIRRF